MSPVNESDVMKALEKVMDPELNHNVVKLGFIQDIDIADDFVHLDIQLTSPHCPAAQSLPRDVEMRVKTVPGVTGVRVDVVWTPPWNPSMMSEAARLELGF